jgi:hypothetical protein
VIRLARLLGAILLLVFAGLTYLFSLFAAMMERASNDRNIPPQ